MIYSRCYQIIKDGKRELGEGGSNIRDPIQSVHFWGVEAGGIVKTMGWGWYIAKLMCEWKI